MPHPKSIHAYDDVREVFEQALQSPRGIQIEFASHGIAIRERSRFNYFRQLDRLSNAEVYPVGHSSHGRSPYDNFTLRVNETILSIEPRTKGSLRIKEIPYEEPSE